MSDILEQQQLLNLSPSRLASMIEGFELTVARRDGVIERLEKELQKHHRREAEYRKSIRRQRRNKRKN